jgi:hypothetical protein
MNENFPIVHTSMVNIVLHQGVYTPFNVNIHL